MNIIVTGATSDIGKAIIKRLASNDSNKILAVYRNEPEKFEKIESNKVKYLPKIDLTEERNLKEFTRSVSDFFNESFTLIHSVGKFWYHKSMENTSFDEIKEMINGHYTTLFNVVKEIIPILRKFEGGRILAFSCNSVGYNYPEMAAFTSAKAAVETLIKCIANENSKYGIVANAIALSTIRTQKVEDSKPPQYLKDYITVDELVNVSAPSEAWRF